MNSSSPDLNYSAVSGECVSASVNLPDDIGDVREVGNDGIWTLSSCKPGYGVEQLMDGNTDTYWQSDGAQPHVVNIQFRCKTPICAVAFYVDFKADESYTPSRISIRTGIDVNDLTMVKQVELKEPAGWQTVDLRRTFPRDSKRPVRAFMVQIAVVQNHQNGRDTHIRQIKIYTPCVRSSEQLQKPLISTNYAKQMPDKLHTIDMNQFATIR